MAKRDNHYEAAFEAWLRERQVPYVAVDEARRSQFPGGSIKSLDFIVSPHDGFRWLVDVKGRRFPTRAAKQYWKNWSTRDDLVSLARWERWFGERFGGLFVFAYNVIGDRAPLPPERLFEFRGGLYAFVGIRVRRVRDARPADFGPLGHAGGSRGAVPRAGGRGRRLFPSTSTVQPPQWPHLNWRRHEPSRTSSDEGLDHVSDPAGLARRAPGAARGRYARCRLFGRLRSEEKEREGRAQEVVRVRLHPHDDDGLVRPDDRLPTRQAPRSP